MPGRAIVIELRPRPGMAPLVGVAVGTLVLAVVLGALANAAFVARYTAVVLPLFLLVVAAGVAVLPGRRFRVGCVAVLILAGLLTGLGENGQQRTQAVQVAAVLNVQAQPGDVVVYCPDQLGPAVDRLLRVPGVTEITFPRAIGPAAGRLGQLPEGHRRHRCRRVRPERPGPSWPPVTPCGWSGGTATRASAATAGT